MIVEGVDLEREAELAVDALEDLKALERIDAEIGEARVEVELVRLHAQHAAHDLRDPGSDVSDRRRRDRRRRSLRRRGRPRRPREPPDRLGVAAGAHERVEVGLGDRGLALVGAGLPERQGHVAEQAQAERLAEAQPPAVHRGDIFERGVRPVQLQKVRLEIGIVQEVRHLAARVHAGLHAQPGAREAAGELRLGRGEMTELGLVHGRRRPRHDVGEQDPARVAQVLGDVGEQTVFVLDVDPDLEPDDEVVAARERRPGAVCLVHAHAVGQPRGVDALARDLDLPGADVEPFGAEVRVGPRQRHDVGPEPASDVEGARHTLHVDAAEEHLFELPLLLDGESVVLGVALRIREGQQPRESINALDERCQDQVIVLQGAAARRIER
ncbi:hypothetical protein BE20_42125 [Sorangium cellulosum]|nr:hypothetical protein BE20_42125 [Sorangium cellulosum]